MAKLNEGDTPGGGGGVKPPKPPKLPKPPKGARNDVYSWARTQGMSIGEANRLADVNPGLLQTGIGDWSGVYAGYKSGGGGEADYGPATVGSFQAPGAGSDFLGTASSDAPFAGVANALLPYLSPDDQVSVRKYLSQNYPDLYGGYADVTAAPAPPITSELRAKFLSAERARQARTAIQNMLGATGVPAESLGSGYDFLNNVISTLEKYGTGPMNREMYSQFSKEVSSLINKAEDNPDAQAYVPLAKLFARPTFEGQGLMDIRQNKRLFG